MPKLISIEEALKDNTGIFIDVRSEGEYQEATIPGAFNIPLLNNNEREIVGKAYKEQGAQAAKELGLTFVSPKLSSIISSFRSLAGEHKPIYIFCWRGGLRSLSIARVLDLFDLDVYRIVGGYKSYRNLVLQYLNQNELPFKAIVLHGLTGVGKTEVLKKLNDNDIPALDLEGLANHRGSAFGHIGLSKQPTQKMFENSIVEFLMNLGENKAFFVECESKRIGKLIIPQLLFQAMDKGHHVLLFDKVENRIKRIVKEYTNTLNDNLLCEAVYQLKKRLGSSNVNKLAQWLKTQRHDDVVNFLLQEYYDPLYKYPDHPSEEYELSVATFDLESSINPLKNFYMQVNK